MNIQILKQEIIAGEDSQHEFKVDINNPDSLAAEITAFANAKGGNIYIGIDDYGQIIGLRSEDVRRINQMISNVASQHIKSPVAVETENIVISENKIVIILKIPQGLDKPYFDRKGIIWLKSGSDKRKINSKEELQRIYQSTAQFHADEQITKASISELDRYSFNEFMQSNFQEKSPENKEELRILLENMNLSSNNKLNLAGLYIFTMHPENFNPLLVVKAVRYPGTKIAYSDYYDSEDFIGPLNRNFENSINFIVKNLHNYQYGQNVNSTGRLEVPKAVFEEILVNAYIHRDYLINSHIKIFVFDDRIEILSPGNLPNNLTVKKILAGNSNIRNPILASYVAKGILPYKGLGTGIRRAINIWPHIKFENDLVQNVFKAIIFRPYYDNGEVKEPIAKYYTKISVEIREPNKHLKKNQLLLLDELIANPAITYDELVEKLNIGRSTVMRNIKIMKKQNVIYRTGAKKNGIWKIT